MIANPQRPHRAAVVRAGDEGCVINRRDLLKGGAAAAGALAVSGCMGNASPWDWLSDAEARTLTVLCDQVIPADDYPSASQAGVLTYIDRQLGRAYRRHRKAYRAGLMQAEQLSYTRFQRELAATSAQQQLAVTRDLEKRERAFFELVRKHTMEGYYGSPRHGGNRDAVSWRMLGLDEPPLRGRAQYDLTRSPHA